MEKIKVSVVSYLNAKPFIYGLENSPIINQIDIQLDIPSVCAQKLIDKTVSIGLVPVAVIPQIKEAKIISDYCIGASGKVSSVMLYSFVPLLEIKTILLDYQSRTSVVLAKVLAKHYWDIHPNWVNATANYETTINSTTAAVIIGDRTFELNNQFPYIYDLSEEWQKFTGLPFVFACWVSNIKLSNEFISSFNSALKFGLDNRSLLISDLKLQHSYPTNISSYLTKNIDYIFDSLKENALTLFLHYSKGV